MIAEQDILKNEQERSPVYPESVEGGKEKSFETEEDLEEYSEGIVAEAEKIIKEMKSEGEQNLGHAEDSIGLSEEKYKEMEQGENIPGQLAEIHKSASDKLSGFEKELEEIINRKIEALSGKIKQSAADRTRDRERIKEINEEIGKEMEKREAEHQAGMTERVKAHEAEMKKIDEEMEVIENTGKDRMAEIKKNHDAEIAAIENAKKEQLKDAPLMVRVAMGDPAAMEEVKKMSAEDILQVQMEDLQKKGENMTDKEKETLKILESAMRYKKQSEGKEDDSAESGEELKKKNEELEQWREEMKKKNEESEQRFKDMISQMSETAEKVKKEAIEAIQQEQYRICENCGGMTKLKDKHCRFCGSKQEELKYCEKCKAYGIGRFCMECGNKLI